MSIDLSKFNDLWENAGPPIPPFERLPDGPYSMVVEDIRLDTIRDGRACLVWEFSVIGPRFARRRHWNRHIFEDPSTKDIDKLKRTFRFLKKNLALFGIHLDKLADLPAHFSTIKGQSVEVVLKTSGDYQNTYINRLITASAASGAADLPDERKDSGPARGLGNLSPFGP